MQSKALFAHGENLMLVKMLSYAVFIAAVLFNPEAIACTVLFVAEGDSVLVGNNEDYMTPHTKIWFHQATAGQLGRVYFGWENEYDFPMGGMNDRGLFFDLLAIPAFSVGERPDRDLGQPFASFVHEMARTCSTVEEALELYGTYDMSGRWEASLFVGDALGHCVLIEGENDEDIVRKSDSTFVATNFLQSKTRPDQITCQRHMIATRMLQEAEVKSVDLIRRTLAATHSEAPFPTVYSNIYDLKKKRVYLYHFHDFEQVRVLDLDKELSKGDRVVDLPSLFTSSFSARAFQDRTGGAVVNPQGPAAKDFGRVPQEYDGKYGAERFFIEVKTEDRELVAEPSLGVCYRLAQVDDDRFVSRRLGVVHDFEFLRNRSGVIVMMLWRANGITIDLRKQKQ